MDAKLTQTHIAVLMTCFNRREATLACLRSLATQAYSVDQLTVIVVDDGSTDGTARAVESEFSSSNRLHLLMSHGDGTLYWAGGTRRASGIADDISPDFVLWLNDDVVLMESALTDLVGVSRLYGDEAIVVGATCDPTTGEFTYGGRRRPSRSPFDFVAVEPSGQTEAVDAMNGNAVLIPASVRERLGPPDKAFRHNMADFDYAFRARASRIDVVQAPDYVGYCVRNVGKLVWEDRQTPLLQRLRTSTLR